MAEIKGEISVTFRVKNAADVQRLMAFCQDFEQSVKPHQPNSKNQEHQMPIPQEKKVRLTLAESQDRIIRMIKEKLPDSMFTTADAAVIVLANLQLGESSTKHALARAVKEGVLIKRGRMYVWTDIVQKQVASKIQEQRDEQTVLQASDSSKKEAVVGLPPIMNS